MPVSSRQPCSAQRANRQIATTHQAPPHAAKAGKENLVLEERETAVHNSFYMPSSTWGDILLVDSSSTPNVTEIGPICTDKYGM